MSTVHKAPGAGCRRGDVVRVRSREEILATLDAGGSAGGLPFMPEMLAYCGKELRVYARADKTCDTIGMTGTRRRMDGTVHLAGARCDGSAHGGCQAGCLLYWREEWLERRDARRASRSCGALRATTGAGATERRSPTRPWRAATPPIRAYRCQATEALRASAPLSVGRGEPVRRGRANRQRAAAYRPGRASSSPRSTSTSGSAPGGCPRGCGSARVGRTRSSRAPGPAPAPRYSASSRVTWSRCAARRRSWRRWTRTTATAA